MEMPHAERCHVTRQHATDFPLTSFIAAAAECHAPFMLNATDQPASNITPCRRLSFSIILSSVLPPPERRYAEFFFQIWRQTVATPPPATQSFAAQHTMKERVSPVLRRPPVKTHASDERSPTPPSSPDFVTTVVSTASEHMFGHEVAFISFMFRRSFAP
jgi:hypothetical protein